MADTSNSDQMGSGNSHANPPPNEKLNQQSKGENLEASFSTLILSIGSSAAMALGLAPNPASGAVEKDKSLARFNIDLLLMLKEKTRNNSTAEEQRFLDSLVHDLQLKFIQK